MKLYCIILSLIFSVSLCTVNPKKIIGLVAARNEAYIIKQCLKALSYYTDAIIFLDDASEDNTLSIVESLKDECKIQKILTKSVWHRDETGDKNLLLNSGRQLGGTHFILLDADEMFSANCLDYNFLRNAILSLEPGEKLVMRLIDLWRSPFQYRIDRCAYSNRILDCAFCDDGICYYDSGFIHASHSPQHRIKGERWLIDEHVVLHFAFVNWQEIEIKYAWYKCLERIRLPEKSAHEINNAYRIDETGMQLALAPLDWFDYDFWDSTIFEANKSWRAEQIKEWFEIYGYDYFADLAIWHIDF